MEELFYEILLPAVRGEIRKKLPPVLRVEWLVQSRIVGPLTVFGLLECRYKEERDREIVAVRKTELFDRFMRWQLRNISGSRLFVCCIIFFNILVVTTVVHFVEF